MPIKYGIRGFTGCNLRNIAADRSVNLLQGDEPLIEPECIDAVVRALQDSPDAVYRWVCC